MGVFGGCFFSIFPTPLTQTHFIYSFFFYVSHLLLLLFVPFLVLCFPRFLVFVVVVGVGGGWGGGCVCVCVFAFILITIKVEWALNTGYLSIYNVCSADTKTLTQGINVRDKASNHGCLRCRNERRLRGLRKHNACIPPTRRHNVATGTSQHVSVFPGSAPSRAQHARLTRHALHVRRRRRNVWHLCIRIWHRAKVLRV